MELRRYLSLTRLTLTVIPGTINSEWLFASDEATRSARPESLLIAFHNWSKHQPIETKAGVGLGLYLGLHVLSANGKP